jgi:large subunit ribosomal protein L31
MYTITTMKTDIHPTYYKNAKAHCACGNSFSVGSTKEIIETEVCSACHPFYTKKEKVLDTLGRVQKFKDRAAKKTGVKKVKKDTRVRGEKSKIKK